jgi:non-homologous end joining protein Ku
MKLFAIAFCFLVVATDAFQPLPATNNRVVESSTKIYGLFDFKTFHGHGSGENNLDEQWEVQQAILRARKGHVDKDHLKAKYKPRIQEAVEAPASAKKVVVKEEHAPSKKATKWLRARKDHVDKDHLKAKYKPRSQEAVEAPASAKKVVVWKHAPSKKV